MDWISFTTGIVSAAFAFVLFTVSNDELEADEVEGDGLVVNGGVGRTVVLSCQTCRKLKRHREIESNLYQCTRCKRHVDLRLP